MSLVGFRARNHPQQKAKPHVDDRGTDPALFARFHERFGFTVDAAALPHNAKLERFWSPVENGLAQSWTGERVWCNPPYSDIRPWIEKAWLECDYAEVIVMLLPANRTEQSWWQELVEPFRDRGMFQVEFLAGRPRFIAPGKDSIGPNERPLFGCCLLIWQNEGA